MAASYSIVQAMHRHDGLTMVAEDFLSDPKVREWLAGVEPAWTLLTFGSLRALRQQRSMSGGPIMFATDLTSDEIKASAAAHNALILIKRAIDTGGLPITATGNLTRAVVADMCKLMDWPDYDQADAFRFSKVINEPDFMPLHIVRLLCEAAGLVKIKKDKLIAPPMGKQCLSDPSGLVALLAQIAFWRFDLSYFARGLLGSWPQEDIGIALWSLSVCGDDWQSAEKLTRLCTIPRPEMLTGDWDRTPFAFEGRILRPLLWFGLVDHRAEQITESRFSKRHFYRKTGLFDRLLKFDVEIERASGSRH
ncbi:hypothetical protein [Pseudorhodoplanes sp.]|uniref:hypothetical protein n=1 Tax=Pseudorhodoplanes sp. TaxID=1934341 RepID=UPI00391D12F7